MTAEVAAARRCELWTDLWTQLNRGLALGKPHAHLADRIIAVCSSDTHRTCSVTLGAGVAELWRLLRHYGSDAYAGADAQRLVEMRRVGDMLCALGTPADVVRREIATLHCGRMRR
jgi:hypothetical protein